MYYLLGVDVMHSIKQLEEDVFLSLIHISLSLFSGCVCVQVEYTDKSVKLYAKCIFGTEESDSPLVVVYAISYICLLYTSSFRKTFPVVVQHSHRNLRDIIAEGIQRIVVFLLHLFAVKD